MGSQDPTLTLETTLSKLQTLLRRYNNRRSSLKNIQHLKSKTMKLKQLFSFSSRSSSSGSLEQGRKVFHTHIKDENILIDLNTFKINLIDFGSGCFLEDR